MKHTHDFTVLTRFDHAPCGPYPEHTSFVVIHCRCGAVNVFPRANYEMTTAEFRREFEATLRNGHMRLLDAEVVNV